MSVYWGDLCLAGCVNAAVEMCGEGEEGGAMPSMVKTTRRTTSVTKTAAVYTMKHILGIFNVECARTDGFGCFSRDGEHIVRD